MGQTIGYLVPGRSQKKGGLCRPFLNLTPLRSLEVVLNRELDHAPASLKQRRAGGESVLVGLHQRAAIILEVQIDVGVSTRTKRPKRMVQEVEG